MIDGEVNVHWMEGDIFAYTLCSCWCHTYCEWYLPLLALVKILYKLCHYSFFLKNCHLLISYYYCYIIIFIIFLLSLSLLTLLFTLLLLLLISLLTILLLSVLISLLICLCRHYHHNIIISFSWSDTSLLALLNSLQVIIVFYFDYMFNDREGKNFLDTFNADYLYS